MISVILSRIVILVLGTLYPAYASFKAVRTKNVKEYVKWMMYWIVFALFTFVETFADMFIAFWMPFYYEIKIIFVLWLLSPATKGASILYRKFVHPHLLKREQDIDSYIAKASDKGYSAVLELGSKGFSYATNMVLTTAMKGAKGAQWLSFTIRSLSEYLLWNKADRPENIAVRKNEVAGLAHNEYSDKLHIGQVKIAEQIKKSYSLSDISDQPDGFMYDNEEDYDQLDNRLEDERYERELAVTQGDTDVGENTEALRKLSYRHADSAFADDGGDRDGGQTSRTAAKRSYSHKEASHMGTLPRTRSQRTPRPPLNKT